MFDLDEFEERAAICEYDGGMTRFAAETQAASEQGIARWEAMDEIRKRHSASVWDHGEAPDGHAAGDMSAVQPHTDQAA